MTRTTRAIVATVWMIVGLLIVGPGGDREAASLSDAEAAGLMCLAFAGLIACLPARRDRD